MTRRQVTPKSGRTAQESMMRHKGTSRARTLLRETRLAGEAGLKEGSVTSLHESLDGVVPQGEQVGRLEKP